MSSKETPVDEGGKMVVGQRCENTLPRGRILVERTDMTKRTDPDAVERDLARALAEQEARYVDVLRAIWSQRP